MRISRLSRREFVAAAMGATRAGTSQPARPNLVLVLSDQQHWQAVGYRDPFFDTPAQNALAKESYVFDHFYCSTPQCSPSRSSIFTGFYPTTTRVMGNIGASGGNDLEIETFAPRLQQAGYYTAYFGKWHLGSHPAANRGWNEEDKETDDQRALRNVLSFLDRAGQHQPFLLVASFLNPHDIYQFASEVEPLVGKHIPLPASWERETFEGKPAVQMQFMTEDQGKVIWGRPREVWEFYREYYRRKVRLFDDALNAIIGKLKSCGLWESTVLVVTSDHGDMDTHHRLIFKGPFMYEQMVRIPLLVRVPRRWGGRGCRVREFGFVNVDLAPTILELAGITPGRCHGQSLAPFLLGRGALPRRAFVVSQYYGKQKWVNPIRMIRTKRFKYNLYIRHGEELYDLEQDPEELVNQAGKPAYGRHRRQLRAMLEGWMKEHDDPFASFRATDRQGRQLSWVGGPGYGEREPAQAEGLVRG